MLFRTGSPLAYLLGFVKANGPKVPENPLLVPKNFATMAFRAHDFQF
jgi:hypothetical protein